MKRILVTTVVGLLAGATGMALAPTQAPAGLFHAPRVTSAADGTTAAGWSSSNWSGYATARATYTSVTGHWKVPSVSRSHKATYSSNWVGIDGFNNSSLIQTGTESDYFNGSAHYDAWWEILPAAETVIPAISVRPGDVMSASITKGSGSSWTITISDSRGGSFTIVKTYSGPGTSAEWIEEAPSVGGRIAPLAHFSLATFDRETANGVTPGLTANDGGIMVQKGAQVSTPSGPDSEADGFNVAYGSTAPAPPTS